MELVLEVAAASSQGMKKHAHLVQRRYMPPEIVRSESALLNCLVCMYVCMRARARACVHQY